MSVAIPQPVAFVPDLATFRSIGVLGYGGNVAYLQGTTTPLDGGQCFYSVNLTDKTTADNGTTCIVDGAGFRWFQVTTPETIPGGLITVPEGGTGLATLTAHGVLIGNGTSNVSVTAAGTATTLLHGNASGDPTWGAVVLTTDVSGVLPVANGGSGIAAGTSGGILGFTGTTTLASSVLLTNHALIVGGGAGATPTPLASLGTTTTVLHGNASGDPTFGAVSLTADVSGTLPVANLPIASGADTAAQTSATVLLTPSTLPNFAGATMHPGYVSGRWYLPWGIDGTAGPGAAIATANARLFPFFVPRSFTLSALGCRITTAAAAGNIQLAIYASSTTTGLPTTLVAHTASISTTSTGVVNSAVVEGSGSVSIPSGLYWMAINADATAGATVVCQAPAAATLTRIMSAIGSATQSDISSGANNVIGQHSVAMAFNTWTADITGTTAMVTSLNNFALIHLKVA